MNDLTIILEFSIPNVSSTAIARFLDGTHSLKEINIQGLSSVMSSQSFKSIADNPSLETLVISDIQESWIRGANLDDMVQPHLFSSLRSLETCMAPETLEALVLHFMGLETLILDASPSSTSILKSTIGLKNLKKLVLNPWINTITQGSDLLSLAMSSGKLVTLEIPKPRNAKSFKSVGIDDALVEQFAFYVPRLERFNILLNGCELTEKSLMSLGRQCPALLECSIEASVDLRALIRDGRPAMWPRLQGLWIAGPRGEAGSLPDDIGG